MGNHCPSDGGYPGLGSAGCVKASPVCQCPVTPGQESRQLEEESVSSTVAQTGRSESYQDKPL